jgi:hypothetical protein
MHKQIEGSYGPVSACYVQDGLLSVDECQELSFILGACGTCGYRDHVTSVTLHDLAAAAPQLLGPLVWPCESFVHGLCWDECALGFELVLQAT